MISCRAFRSRSKLTPYPRRARPTIPSAPPLPPCTAWTLIEPTPSSNWLLGQVTLRTYCHNSAPQQATKYLSSRVPAPSMKPSRAPRPPPQPPGQRPARRGLESLAPPRRFLCHLPTWSTRPAPTSATPQRRSWRHLLPHRQPAPATRSKFRGTSASSNRCNKIVWTRCRSSLPGVGVDPRASRLPAGAMTPPPPVPASPTLNLPELRP